MHQQELPLHLNAHLVPPWFPRLPSPVSRPSQKKRLLWQNQTLFVNYGFAVTQAPSSDRGGALRWRRLSATGSPRSQSVPVLFTSIRGIYSVRV